MDVGNNHGVVLTITRIPIRIKSNSEPNPDLWEVFSGAYATWLILDLFSLYEQVCFGENYLVWTSIFGVHKEGINNKSNDDDDDDDDDDNDNDNNKWRVVLNLTS